MMMTRTSYLHLSTTSTGRARSPRRSARWLAVVSSLAMLGACSGKLPDDGKWTADETPDPDKMSTNSPNAGDNDPDAVPGAGESTVKVDASGNPVDEDGNPLLDASGNPTHVNENGEVVDQNGNPVTDAAGNPLVVDVTDPDGGAAPAVLPAGELRDCSTPGPRQVRRLTVNQYDQSVRAIFGETGVAVDGIFSDASALGFHVDAKASVVRDLEGELLMNYAESVADWAVDNDQVSQFTSCTEQQASCQREFISNLGAKAHREPLNEARIDAYQGLFAEEATFADGARAVVGAMLQSPYMLYRLEMGTQQGSGFKLTPYEVASQLSYWLTDAPPDAQLYDAAKNGRLNTTEDLTREASRLLETEQARDSLARFAEGWLHLDKLTSKAKDESLLPLPAELRASMLQETRELFLNTFYQSGSLADLFTATHTFVDQRLASHYGMSASGAAFERVELSGTRRPAGILGHAAFLTTHALSDNSSPVQRGKTVIERLLCGTLPPVPSNLSVALDTQTEFATNRERYEVHRERAECRSCHQNMDPIGYAFEHLDGFGLYRDQENGVDIDATGALALLASGSVELDGVDSLSQALADSPELQSCLVRYWSYYAFGAEGWADSECNRDGVVRYAKTQDFSLKSVVLGIAQAPHFSRRVTDL